MTHVKIRTGDAPGAFNLEVDGVDMSMAVLAGGLRVEFPESYSHPAMVHLVIAADVLDIDLPDAALEAIRRKPEARVAEVDEEAVRGYFAEMRRAQR